MKRTFVVGIAAALGAMVAVQGTPLAAPNSPTQGSNAPALAQARVHFDKGMALFGQDAWTAALEEFSLSLNLYRTPAATVAAGNCFWNLLRYEEALDTFEGLLRDFNDLPTTEKQEAQRAIIDLRKLVGTLDVVGAEPGAAIVVDGRDRGRAPAVTPIRVGAGVHYVRISKEGFEPFEARTQIAGGDTARVDCKLRPLHSSGRLEVTEASGGVFDVLVDDVVVGKTPWSGILSSGYHVVALRGDRDLGALPRPVTLRNGQTISLKLGAEALRSILRVEPHPADAQVSVDGVLVGRGVWEGKLKDGRHRVEVKAEGFYQAIKEPALEPGQRKVLPMRLEHDPDAPMWKQPPRMTFDLGMGLVIVPSFGGDVAGGCRDGCQMAPGFGGLAMIHAGYELGWGLNFGVAGGGLLASQTTVGRSTVVVPNGLASVSGTATDQLSVKMGLVGPTIGVHWGDRLQKLVRLGAGLLLGEVRDVRSGSFEMYQTAPVETRVSVAWIYVDPEIRLGYRVGEHLELGAGVHALLLIPRSTARWSEGQELMVTSQSLGTYRNDALMGVFVPVIAPTVSARYDY